jgi:hypothetical protein
MRSSVSAVGKFTAVLGLGVAMLASAPAADFARDIKPLLAKYCYDCHDTATRESGLDLERFSDLSTILPERALWGSVLEKVESRQMPPPKEENPPTAAERRALVDWITQLAGLPDPALGAPDPGKPLLRRLTRLEYNNSVRDLLGLGTDVFMFPERLPFADKAYFQPARGTLGDTLEVRLREYGSRYPVLLPASGLPGDNRAEHGYRNRGDANNLSPLLLEKYVALAGEIAHHPDLLARSPVFAELLGVNPPPPAPPSARPVASAPAADPAGEFAPRTAELPAAPGAAVALADFRRQLATAVREGRGGVFDVPASVSNQTIAGKGGLIVVPFGERRFTVNPNADVWLAGFSTAQATSGGLIFTNKVKGAKTLELTFEVKSDDPDEGVETLAVCVVGRRGQSGRVSLTARFSDATEARLSASIADGAGGTTYFSFTALPGETITRLDVDGSGFSGDYVLLDDLGFITNGKPQPVRPPAATPPATPVVTTPVAAPAPPAPVAAPPKPRTFPPLRERVAAFVERAYRRPVTAAEVDRLLALVPADKPGSPAEAAGLRALVQAVLASPGFLFLAEPVNPALPSVRPLDDFELAARLSYFLWASMPDAELSAVARSGRLRDPATLAAQTRRMLHDPKARELGEAFAVQWLRLDQLYTAKPDTDLFKVFYSGPQGKDTLHGAMLTEALLLFETVLVEDRSILDFIGADYTWLNPRLARAYQLGRAGEAAPAPIPGGAGNRELREAANRAANTWRRTPLPDRTRGGFITMAGPLTVTSLPFRTSPVKRGAWLLETIFNRPPQEPKVAFAIENDTKEAAAGQSIRQKFEAHRNQPACYSCHVRLDPPGFALERFDPVGRWRESDGGQPVDARGEWNGQPFDGPADYKAALLRDPREFNRGFIEHLLGYALGRKPVLTDLPAVQAIEQATAGSHRLSEIIVALVQSYPFRHVRNHDVPRQP